MAKGKSKAIKEAAVAVGRALDEHKNGLRAGAPWAFGSLPRFAPPLLEVDGVGAVPLPLQAETADRLRAVCERAPFGDGDETRRDDEVRRTWQVPDGAARVTNPEWNAMLDDLLRDRVKPGLGLDGDTAVRAELYRVLLYDEGGHFKAHRDTQRFPRHFGTLVLTLPSPFEGGGVDFALDGAGKAHADLSRGSDAYVSYAAWYADVTHTVLPVRTGRRLTLVYNLAFEGDGSDASACAAAVSHAAPAAAVAGALDAWLAAYTAPPPAAEGKSDDEDGDEYEDEDGDEVVVEATVNGEAEVLALPLQHQYTKDGLQSLDALKGADRSTVALVDAALKLRPGQFDAYVARYGVDVRVEYDCDNFFNNIRPSSDNSSMETKFFGMCPLSDTAASPMGAAGMSCRGLGKGTPFVSFPPDGGALYTAVRVDGAAQIMNDGDWTHTDHGGAYTGNEVPGEGFEYEAAALVLWPAARRHAIDRDLNGQVIRRLYELLPAGRGGVALDYVRAAALKLLEGIEAGEPRDTDPKTLSNNTRLALDLAATNDPDWGGRAAALFKRLAAGEDATNSSVKLWTNASQGQRLTTQHLRLAIEARPSGAAHALFEAAALDAGFAVSLAPLVESLEDKTVLLVGARNKRWQDENDGERVPSGWQGHKYIYEPEEAVPRAVEEALTASVAAQLADPKTQRETNPLKYLWCLERLSAPHVAPQVIESVTLRPDDLVAGLPRLNRYDMENFAERARRGEGEAAAAARLRGGAEAFAGLLEAVFAAASRSADAGPGTVCALANACFTHKPPATPDRLGRVLGELDEERGRGLAAELLKHLVKLSGDEKASTPDDTLRLAGRFALARGVDLAVTVPDPRVSSWRASYSLGITVKFRIPPDADADGGAKRGREPGADEDDGSGNERPSKK